MKSSMPNNNNNIAIAALSCDITNNNIRKRNVVRSCLVTKAKVSNIVSTILLIVSFLILVTTITIIPYVTVAFTPTSIIPTRTQQQQYYSTTTQLYNSKPSRLEENVDGVVYVNDKCIDCAACKGFASQIFRSNPIDTAHIVYQQPKTLQDIVMTRAALAACPVAAIRIESYAERNHKTSIHNKNIQMKSDGTTTASTVQVANDIIQDVAWSEQDSWIVQQMTSKEMKRPFPRPFLLNETIETSTINHFNDEDDFKTVVPDVYWTGHHNERSFGAIPYLVKAYYNNTNVWIMIDVPKFNIQSVRDIISLTGPNGPHYLFMTHVDDTADHELWANYFNSTSSGYCQRIFHSGDLGRYNWIGDTTLENVPILLQSLSTPINSNSLTAYTLDGTILNDDNWIEQFENGFLNTDVVILHTPGHSPGSCTLYKRRRTMKLNNDENDSKTIPGVLFTGDTYAYTGTKMSGFPRYGRNMVQQNHTLSSLVMELQQWDIIAPGHGLPRDYRNVPKAIRITELEQAQLDLFKRRR